MPFNLLLVPLLGGFIFISLCNRTRFHVARSDKDRLLIYASIAGLASVVIAHVVYLLAAYFFPCSSYSTCLSSWWKERVPFEYSDISFIALGVNLISIPLANCFWQKDRELDRLIKEDRDALEMILTRAQDENVTVSVTMTNEKVYVGFVTYSFNPITDKEHKSIGIYPVKSGYRDPVTKQLMLPIDYSEALSRISEDILKLENANIKLRAKAEAKPKDRETIEESLTENDDKLAKLQQISGLFTVAIPITQIASINLYDKDVHDKYFIKS